MTSLLEGTMPYLRKVVFFKKEGRLTIFLNKGADKQLIIQNVGFHLIDKHNSEFRSAPLSQFIPKCSIELQSISFNLKGKISFLKAKKIFFFVVSEEEWDKEEKTRGIELPLLKC